MIAGTTSTLTFRIESGLKGAPRAAAHREHRYVVNMVKFMIRDYCGPNWIDFAEIRSVRVSCYAIRC